MRHDLIIAGLLTLVLSCLIGCASQGPTPIHYGADLCDYCDMTIADKGFGAELVTSKGKVLKYDSIECLAAAELANLQGAQGIHSRWVTDFGNPGTFLIADSAVIVATDRQKSPMGVGLVALSDRARADGLIAAKGGRVVDWNETKLLVAESWKLELPR